MPRPYKLTFDLLTLTVVSESRVTCPNSVPVLVFLGLSLLDLGLMYATDVRQTSDAHHRLMPPTLGAGHKYASLASSSISATIPTGRSSKTTCECHDSLDFPCGKFRRRPSKTFYLYC